VRLLLSLALLLGGADRVADDGAQPALTPNGRYLAYVQNARTGTDVFVLDRRTGRRERVSVGPGGRRGNASSFEPSISADGRYVAFCSVASNFAPGDALPTTSPLRPEYYRDVFVRDRLTKRTIRVSSPGGEKKGWSCHPSISGDGRRVAYVSNIGDGAGASPRHALHDRKTRRTVRLATTTDAWHARGSFSRDGRRLAYSDLNGVLFLRDNATGRSQRIGTGGGPSLSADARRVAFTRGSPLRAYVLDIGTGRETDLGDADDVELSADGRVAVWHWNDRVTARNLATGRSGRVDVPGTGGMTWEAAFIGPPSGDGRIVPYVATSSDGLPAGQRRQALFVRAGW
jgi:Tol biopolymer transport system component